MPPGRSPYPGVIAGMLGGLVLGVAFTAAVLVPRHAGLVVSILSGAGWGTVGGGLGAWLEDTRRELA